MTIICYRDGVLAADTGVFDGDIYVGTTEKIAIAPDGTIGGAAGPLGDIRRFLSWLESGRDGEAPSSGEMTSVFITPQGLVSEDEGSGFFHVEAPYFATGIAHTVALGAMAAGASAEEAVRICCQISVYAREPISVIRLGDRRQ